MNIIFEDISKDNKMKDENTIDIISGKLYLKIGQLIEKALNSNFAPENLKKRLKNYSEQKIIEEMKKQMINVDNFFFTIVESIKFIRKTRCLNEFTKMDKNNMGWLSVKQINNYFIDPIKKHNIKTKLKSNDKVEFEKFYKIYNEYNGIKNLNFSKKNIM